MNLFAAGRQTQNSIELRTETGRVFMGRCTVHGLVELTDVERWPDLPLHTGTCPLCRSTISVVAT